MIRVVALIFAGMAAYAVTLAAAADGDRVGVVVVFTLGVVAFALVVAILRD